jgi:predicted phosphodiesterase
MAKKIIFAVITILFVFWIASRWNVWFNKHPEPQFQLTESVVGVQLTVGDNPLSERIVSWRSRPDSALLHDNAVRLIWISDTDTLYPHVNKKWIKSGGGEAIYYWSEVEVQEGEYRYAISTPDTITHYFSTRISDADSLEILVLGDVQDKSYNPTTDSAVHAIAQNYNPDFILQLGDLIDRPHQDKWDIYFHSFEPLRTSVPIMSIVGNHDYHKGINKHPDERFFYTFPYFLEDNSAPKIGCCELDFGSTHIYILDSNQPVFRQFVQRKWLKSKLKNIEKGVRKIVALHHPLRSARSGFNNLLVRLLFEGVVKRYDVELVLAGHEHTNHALTKEETGGYEQIITNFSFKNYEDAQGEGGRKSIVLTIKR